MWATIHRKRLPEPSRKQSWIYATIPELNATFCWIADAFNFRDWHKCEVPRWVLVPQGIDPAPYVAAADRIAAGALTVFSVSCANGGSPPHWNCDPKTGTVAPLTPGKLLDYRDRRLVGDIKYLWEVNRHLQLVTLAQGYALTREAKYLRALQQHLESWIRACPHGRGPNWCSR